MTECKTLNGVNHGPVTNFPLHVFWSEPQVDTSMHQHSFVELVLILKGSSVHYFDKTSHPVAQGDVIVIPPGVTHYYRNSTADFALVNIVFLPDQMPIPLIDVPLLPGFDAVFHGTMTDRVVCPHVRLPTKDFKQMLVFAEQLREEDRTRTSGYRFTMLGIFMMILSKLAKIFSHAHGRNPQLFLHINGVIFYLNRHFKERCSLARLCREAGMSRATLQRNFLNATGTSPRQYQLQLRIAEATTLLRSSDKTMDEIAADLGFGNRNYFSRQFRKIMGCSPTQIRKKQHNGNFKSI